MADEEQAVYEQYPPFKDVKGVGKYFFTFYIFIFIFIIIVISKNSYRNERRYFGLYR